MAGKRSENPRGSAAKIVRGRVERGGARFWRHADFDDLPPEAVATALSRMTRDGELQRTAKGVYYRSVPTSLGMSVPVASGAIAQTFNARLHPAGLSAANMLGLSTQNPGRPEYATPAPSIPSALKGAVVHTGRPAQRARLSSEDGAVLEILRERARSSDLPPAETVARLRRELSDGARYRRLVNAAMAEPPRVRAMLGALGQELEMPEPLLKRLRKSLKPLSKYDFGKLSSLRYAKSWQAR
jgi:uncharacterized protein DUF6088